MADLRAAALGSGRSSLGRKQSARVLSDVRRHQRVRRRDDREKYLVRSGSRSRLGCPHRGDASRRRQAGSLSTASRETASRFFVIPVLATYPHGQKEEGGSQKETGGGIGRPVAC